MSDDSKKTKQENVATPRIEDLFPTYANLRLGEEEVNALTVKERQELLSRLDYRRKYQLLRSADDLPELLAGLSPEDFFFTIESAGRTDAMDLVLSATPAQLSHTLDVSCWTRNDFHPEELLDWLGNMIQQDPDECVARLRDLDPELLMLTLGRYVAVRRPEWTEDRSYIDDNRYFSLDDQNLLELVEPENPRNERAMVLLQMLYRLDIEHFRYLMEALLWELPSNLEEHALRSRADRMIGRGYPEYLESIALFSPADPEKLKTAILTRTWPEKRPPKGKESLPVFYRHFLSGGSFLFRVLKELDDADQERIRTELVFLANRILVAREALSDLEKVRESLTEAHHTLSLGLEFASEGRIERGLEILRRAPAGEVFRVGYNLTLNLHKQAKHFEESHLARHRRALSLLGTPTREVLMGLLRKPPLYYTGAEPGELRPETRLFASHLEIERAAAWLERAVFLFDLHFRLMGLRMDQVFEGASSIGVEPLEADQRLLKIFFTAYANLYLEGKLQYRPISRENFERLLSDWLQPAGAGAYALRPDFGRDLNAWMFSMVVNEPEAYRQLASDWAVGALRIIERLASELETLTHSGAIRLSRVLLLE